MLCRWILSTPWQQAAQKGVNFFLPGLWSCSRWVQIGPGNRLLLSAILSAVALDRNSVREKVPVCQTIAMHCAGSNPYLARLWLEIATPTASFLNGTFLPTIDVKGLFIPAKVVSSWLVLTSPAWFFWVLGCNPWYRWIPEILAMTDYKDPLRSPARNQATCSFSGAEVKVMSFCSLAILLCPRVSRIRIKCNPRSLLIFVCWPSSLFRVMGANGIPD